MSVKAEGALFESFLQSGLQLFALRHSTAAAAALLVAKGSVAAAAGSTVDPLKAYSLASSTFLASYTLSQQYQDSRHKTHSAGVVILFWANLSQVL